MADRAETAVHVFFSFETIESLFSAYNTLCICPEAVADALIPDPDTLRLLSESRIGGLRIGGLRNVMSYRENVRYLRAYSTTCFVGAGGIMLRKQEWLLAAGHSLQLVCQLNMGSLKETVVIWAGTIQVRPSRLVVAT